MVRLEHVPHPGIEAPEVGYTFQSRVVLTVDLHKIRQNYLRIMERVQPLRVMAILKANAYGLGVSRVARCLKDAGVHAIGVAELREALAIRELGIPVQILGGLIPDEVPAVVHYDITATVGSRRVGEWLSQEAVRQKKIVNCHVKLDTGMGRLGLQCHEAVEAIRYLASLPNLRLQGIFSHFSSANSDHEYSMLQVDRFQQILGQLAAHDIHFQYVHIANSDGINNIPAALKYPFNMVRTGINLYGVFDMQGQQSMELLPALEMTARVVGVRDLPAGTTIGYSRTYKLSKPTRVGTVCIGYADGLPIAMSNCGVVYIRGSACRILGRISMDYTTVDLSDVPDAQEGDLVTCIGKEITVADWARYKGTIPYEIICSIGNRVARRYIGDVQTETGAFRVTYLQEEHPTVEQHSAPPRVAVAS